jgi:replication-associated recombination protein RarA
MPKLQTKNGYDYGEVISSLQKCIRRGLEEEAMYWAMEMMPRFHAAFWRRLKVIVNEDIGLANPFAVVLVQTLHEQFNEQMADKKQKNCPLFIANAILFMCRGPKTRIADYFQTCVQHKAQQGFKVMIPDFALDKHTSGGKAKRRGWKHWFKEGCKLEGERQIDNVSKYKEAAQDIWASGKLEELDW